MHIGIGPSRAYSPINPKSEVQCYYIAAPPNCDD